MLKPERMTLLQVVVLDDDVVSASAHLAAQNVVHLVDRSIAAPELREGTPESYPTVRSTLASLSSAVDELASWFAEEGFPPRAVAGKVIELDPGKVTETLGPTITKLAGDLRTMRATREQAHLEIIRLARISDTLQSFASAGLFYTQLIALRHFDFVAGTMPLRFQRALEESLNGIPHHLELRRLDDREGSVIIIAPKSHIEAVRAALKTVYFPEVQVPEAFRHDPEAAMDDIEVQLWSNREEHATLTRRIRARCHAAVAALPSWRRAVRANLRLLDATQQFGKTARTTLVSGWVPARRAATLVEGLNTVVGGLLVADLHHPDAQTGLAHDLVQAGKVRVPTKFQHPPFLRPFQALITMYGYPEYDGLDPTIFTAVTFFLMFGMMFGDVGQGAVLALAGIVLTRLKLPASVRNAGWLLVAAGSSAILFGVLFGSLFGIEGIIPAVWMLPMENVSVLLGTAIAIGVIMTTLGVLLNVVQAARRRNVKEMLFGQWGLFTGVFYWVIIALIYFAAVKQQTPPVLVLLGMLFAPLALIIAGDIVCDRLTAAAHHGSGEEHSLAETMFKPVEILISVCTQTFSFVRVGAFALSHAALMMVVFILAQMVGNMSEPGATSVSRTAYVLMAVAGNVFVMALEGMVVFIQCLRLEYYEFFSKFFTGSGVPYLPLHAEEAEA